MLSGNTEVGPVARRSTNSRLSARRSWRGSAAASMTLPSNGKNATAGEAPGGNASAGQISLLATKPLGVKAVVNPIAAAPGSDPEGRESGRRNAPLGVAPVDRLVSVPDYEQFALGFGGDIGNFGLRTNKAKAVVQTGEPVADH